MTTDEQLKRALEKLKEGGRQAQLRWVKVDSVNKEEKLMDATGIMDDLAYYDIPLGLGALTLIPKQGASCLVGIVEGQETDAFLISAEEVDEILIDGGKQGGLIKVQEMVERLNVLEKDINKLKQVFVGWTPVTQDGGASLKTAIASYAGQTLTETKREDIENERVKQ